MNICASNADCLPSHVFSFSSICFPSFVHCPSLSINALISGGFDQHMCVKRRPTAVSFFLNLLNLFSKFLQFPSIFISSPQCIDLKLGPRTASLVLSVHQVSSICIAGWISGGCEKAVPQVSTAHRINFNQTFLDLIQTATPDRPPHMNLGLWGAPTRSIGCATGRAVYTPWPVARSA
jgi:hypothetical protein